LRFGLRERGEEERAKVGGKPQSGQEVDDRLAAVDLFEAALQVRDEALSESGQLPYGLLRKPGAAADQTYNRSEIPGSKGPVHFLVAPGPVRDRRCRIGPGAGGTAGIRVVPADRQSAPHARAPWSPWHGHLGSPSRDPARPSRENQARWRSISLQRYRHSDALEADAAPDSWHCTGRSASNCAGGRPF